jgi:hypothetical protein
MELLIVELTAPRWPARRRLFGTLRTSPFRRMSALRGGLSLALCVSHQQLGRESVDYDRIVNWKTDSPQRILRACQNPVIGPANAARFMTAASIS